LSVRKIDDCDEQREYKFFVEFYIGRNEYLFLGTEYWFLGKEHVKVFLICFGDKYRLPTTQVCL